MPPDSYGTKYGTVIGTEGHGQSLRRSLPARRPHISQKVSIAGQRTLYISIRDNEQPAEIFLRQNVGPLIKSPDEDLPQDTQQDKSLVSNEDEG